MENMNKKAQDFQAMLDKEKSTAFVSEAIEDEFHSVVFRSHLVIRGQQLPFMIIIDDSLYTILRTVIVPQAKAADQNALLQYLNEMDQKYKAFKYYADGAGNILLDCCVPASDEKFDPEVIRAMIQVILQQLENDYPEIMKVVWGGTVPQAAKEEAAVDSEPDKKDN